jgi:transportin-3
MTHVGFLDVSLAAALESREHPSDGSPGVVLAQILARCGEGLMSNVLYALLGVSALSRVGTVSKSTIVPLLPHNCSYACASKAIFLPFPSLMFAP